MPNLAAKSGNEDKMYKKHHIRVGTARTGYVGQPGSTKDLFPVYIDNKFEMEVGPRNSFGLKPGMETNVEILRDNGGRILHIR